MEIIGKIKRLAERFNFRLNTHNYLSFQVFREDFTLCLMLGDFLSDPILSDSPDLSLSIYGDKAQFRTAKLSSLHLHLAENIGNYYKVKTKSKNLVLKYIYLF